VCGITGIVASGTDIDANYLAGMIAMLNHRGPDDRGMHIEPGAGLAHARLSILDLAGGCQRMANEDRSLWITFNGEIFNYVELSKDLVQKGHRFSTRSDTEVILHLYEEEGADAVHKLNGQWAFGIWNTRTRTLFLSRDRLGVRPLYYTICGDQHSIWKPRICCLVTSSRPRATGWPWLTVSRAATRSSIPTSSRSRLDSRRH
jgi:asparagine synthase (glutamine-hydrolysing)